MTILAHSKSRTKPIYEQVPLADKQVTTARNLEDIEKICSIWEEMQRHESSPVPNADIDRYVAGIKAKGKEVRPYIILIEQGNKPVAMVIGRIEKHCLKIKFGYKTLFTTRLKRLGIVYGGILGHVSDEICAIIVRELIDTLKHGEADYIYFNHLK